jgi:hypothetical protein
MTEHQRDGDDSPATCPNCGSESVKKVYQPQPSPRIPDKTRWILDRCRDCEQLF